jgi:hypothetical protein
MERKKTREKMRRQEVNDRFQELMEALHEVDGGAEVKAELAEEESVGGHGLHGHNHHHANGSPHGLSCLAAGCDKGNFRVDVLSRAVRVIKVRLYAPAPRRSYVPPFSLETDFLFPHHHTQRLHKEVQTERGEVERLRQLLGQASISEATATTTKTAAAAPSEQESSQPATPAPVQQVQVPEQQQQQPQEQPRKPLQQAPTPATTAAVPMLLQPTAGACGVGKPGAGPAPPMWVTVPMWMGQQPMAGGAKGMSFPMPMNGAAPGAPGGFPFAAMPFFMPNPGGGAPIPAMQAPYMVPAPQAAPAMAAAVTTAGAATGAGAGNGSMEMDDGELPTHAPCA